MCTDDIPIAQPSGGESPPWDSSPRNAGFNRLRSQQRWATIGESESYIADGHRRRPFLASTAGASE